MARKLSYWICRRQQKGRLCLRRNDNRKQLCEKCGKAKPKKSPSKHMAALNNSYEHFIDINGGEHCGICGRGPTPGRRLDRDHAHTTGDLGEARGLLCPDCNRHLGGWYTIGRVRALLAYLERHEVRMGRMAIIDTNEGAA